MRACWATKLLVLVQPSPASCATCRGTSALHRVLALTHRHLHKSPRVRPPFAEISWNIVSSSPVVSFPETVPNIVCHLKDSLQTHSITCLSPKLYPRPKMPITNALFRSYLDRAPASTRRFL